MKRFKIRIHEFTSKLCREIIDAHKKEDIILDIEYLCRRVELTTDRIKITNRILDYKGKFNESERPKEDEFTKLTWIDSDGDKFWTVALELTSVSYSIESVYEINNPDDIRHPTYSIVILLKKGTSLRWDSDNPFILKKVFNYK